MNTTYNEFILKHDTSDEEIHTACYADLMHQMRLRQKTFHKYDRSELEKFPLEYFIKEVFKCRDLILNRYNRIKKANTSLNPSLLDTLDESSIPHEYNVFIKNNKDLEPPVSPTPSQMRSFLKANRPGWNIVLKKTNQTRGCIVSTNQTHHILSLR